jgi:hypothetical protein
MSLVAVVGRGDRTVAMERPNLSDGWSPVSRRQALIGIGTLASGATTTAYLATDRARADVAIGDLSVSDETFEAESIDPKLVVDVQYRYDASGASVDSVRFRLLVGGGVLDETQLSTSQESLEESTRLEGRLASLDAYASGDFAPEVGGSVTESFEATVAFDVLDADETPIASAEVTDTVTVSVSHPQENEYEASVGGDGRGIDASQ